MLRVLPPIVGCSKLPTLSAKLLRVQKDVPSGERRFILSAKPIL